MAKKEKSAVGRRGFLKGAAVGAAAIAAGPAGQAQAPTNAPSSRPAALPPTPAQRAAETSPPAEDIQIVERPGSDYMVDVFNSLGLEYLFATPGSSFRGIHESAINHGGNRPEFITCMHEECSVAMGMAMQK